MVIIFYDSEKSVIYLCTEREKMRILPVDEPNLLSHIPNDDILYVQNAHFITKNQFSQWLEGEGEISENFTLGENSTSESPDSVETYSENVTGKWIHPCHNGAIHIADIKSKKYPNGVELVGKYEFASVEDLGGFDTLEESSHYRYLLGKGKIEVVGYEYVKKNQGKNKKRSRRDAALDRITIQTGSAESVAAAGGIQSHAGDVEGFIVD